MSRLCLLFALLAAYAAPARAAFQVPPLTGPVVDAGGMLDEETRQNLDRALRTLWNQGGSQIAVLTVPSLEGDTIEQASIKVTDQWQLGTAKGDNGVLLMIARDEKKLRIEVGQGLEGALTDAKTRRIIDDSMVPLLRRRDVNAAVVVGVYQITRVTDPNFDMKALLDQVDRRTVGSDQSGEYTTLSGGQLIVYLIIFFIVLPFIAFAQFLQRGRRRYRRSGWGDGGGWGGGGWGGGGGGWGGGGGGGGGFSGGGGGFSGGGASGSW